jgi:hypothetical protein
MTDRFALKYVIPPSMREGQPNLGEGISRHVPGEPTRLYRVLVRIPGNTPMKVLVRAESTKRAQKYALNRWPASTVEVLK